MVNERRIRDRIAQATSATERTGIRATEVAAALAGIIKRQRLTRDAVTLEFKQSPKIVYDRQRNPIGVEVWVRCFDGGVERHIDPHRVITNPPTMVPDGTTHTEMRRNGPVEVPNLKEDAGEAFLLALLQSIDEVPNPGRWLP